MAGPAAPSSPARWLRIGLLLFAALVLALALQALLLVHKERDALVEITVSRVAVDADEVRALVARDAAMGMHLTESRGLPRLLAQQVRGDPDIESIQVFDLDGDVLFAAGAATPTPPAALAAAIGHVAGHWFDASALLPAGQLRVGRALVDAEDKVAGGVLIVVRAQRLAEQISAGRAAMWPRLGLTLVGMALALGPLLWLAAVGTRWGLTLRTRLLVAALLAAATASLALTLQTLPSFTQRIAPALDAKAARVAGFLASRVSHALALGIPADRLNGVEPYLEEALSRHAELVSLQWESAGSRFEARRAGPVDRSVAATVTGADGQAAGRLLAGIDADVALRSLRTLAADLAIVFLVAVVFFNEALGAILAGGTLAGNVAPAAAPAGPERLGLARLAVFLLILAEELTRAFLPLHAASLAHLGELPERIAIGLPIAAYMASFALLTPFAGRWAARLGVGRTFALGALLSAAGFGLALASQGYVAFVAARCVCAAGYAIGTMAMQHHFLRSGGSGGRTRALALLVGAVQTAAICGAPIGGLLADRFGSGAVFAGAVALSLLALVMQRLDSTTAARQALPEAAPPLWPLLRQRGVWLPLLSAALPVKLVLAGFLFYLVPIALRQEGFNGSDTGRAMMLYFLLVAASNPVASWLADRLGWQRALVVAGGLVVGCGGLAGLLGGTAAVIAGIGALGLGTGLSAAALQALVVREGAGAVVLLRTVERLGAVIGPLLAGSLLGLLAYGGVMAVIGAVMIGATLMFALGTAAPRRVS